MKKLSLLVLIIMSVFVGAANAQDLVKYQSEENGIQILFPGEAIVETDESDELTLEGDDYIFVAIPFDPEELTEDEIAEAFSKLLTASNCDISKAKKQDLETKTLTGGLYIAANESILSLCGILASKDDENFAFMFHMAAPHDKMDIAVKAVKSLNYHPEAISE